MNIVVFKKKLQKNKIKTLFSKKKNKFAQKKLKQIVVYLQKKNRLFIK